MASNPYVNNYNPQAAKDRIDNQIAQLQQMKEQLPQISMPQQPAINQTFQLASNNNNGIKYVETIDDVNKEIVFVDTPFFSKDMSVVWIKNNKNEIKSYELNEIIQKDEKDLLIDSLMLQIEDLKKGVNNNEHSINVNVNEPIKDKKSTNVQYNKSSNSKQK